jgi:hypothetical protein
MEVVKPLGLSTVGLVMRFSVARNYGGLATALAQPANSGVSNGGIAKPQWQSGWGWAGVSLGLVDVERGFSALIADNGGGVRELATMIERQVLEQAAPEAPSR